MHGMSKKNLPATHGGRVGQYMALALQTVMRGAFKRSDIKVNIEHIAELARGAVWLSAIDLPVPFALLLNLVSASNAQNKQVLWGFISRYSPGTTPETHPELDRLAEYAIRYFDDFVKPQKKYRAPDAVERQALSDVAAALAALPPAADGEAIQNAALNVARRIERYQDHSKQSPEGGPGVSVAFFQMIYEVLIGQERGPRFGSFAALYGIAETRALIDRALQGDLVG